MNQLLHIDGITHLYHYGFMLFMVCHGNATYKRLNTKIIEISTFRIDSSIEIMIYSQVYKRR